MINKKHLDFWIENKYNVLFEGHQGVGKTSIVKEAFERNNLRWKYFSASTMDPWVDLIGVPREKIDENGNKYLDLIRPRDLENDEIEAIMFDELNRSKPKIKNAVMELIQFKSINGKKFSNLKIVWAAINPYTEDEEYDVERLDPAQEDRFHIKVTIPYKPYKPYFIKKYGNIAEGAIEWWNKLPENVKRKVSPRRLDYVLDLNSKGGDINYALPASANTNQLLTLLNVGPITKKLETLYKEKDDEKTIEFLNNDNNFLLSSDIILKKEDYFNYFIPKLRDEKIVKLASKKSKFLDKIIVDSIKEKKYKTILEDIIKIDSLFSRKVKTKIKRNKNVKAQFFPQETNLDSTPQRLNRLEEMAYKSELNQKDIDEIEGILVRTQIHTIKYRKSKNRPSYSQDRFWKQEYIRLRGLLVNSSCCYDNCPNIKEKFSLPCT